MGDAILRRQLVERPAIGKADQFAAWQLLLHGMVALECVQRGLRQVEHVVALADADVGQLGVDGSGNVGGERPGCRRPDQQRLPRPFVDRELEIDTGVGHLPVALGDDLHVGEAGGAARAPGHGVLAFVEPAPFVADLEEVPDGVVVLVGVGVVGVVPVHPLGEPKRLLGDLVGEALDALLARVDEAVDAVGLDVALRREAELSLHLHLDPETLAVVAVLVALAEALHRLVALEGVLVGAAPGVMHAHRVVGGDRPIDERPALRRRFVAAEVQLEDVVIAPPAEPLALLGGEVRLRIDGLPHCCHLFFRQCHSKA